MEIPLKLSRHCIKCAAAKAHEARLYACFKAAAEKRGKLLEELEALRVFLETTDFPEIRARYPVLAGETDKDVVLELDGEGGYALVFDGMRVTPPGKISLSPEKPAPGPEGALRIVS